MSNNFYTEVPHQMGVEQYGQLFIKSFPDLHTVGTFGQRRKQIRDQLKYQLLTTKREDAKNYVTMRECFKYHDRNIVEFCLKEKIPQVTFEEAVVKLGYRK